MTNPLNERLHLPCGAVLPNRIGKSAMTEGLADEYNRATPDLERLYRAWSHGGAGLLMTGNVQVNRGFLERPGNMAIDGNGGLDALRKVAKAGTEAGNHFWVQLSHAGRQTPASICPEPVAPSAVPIEGFTKEAFNPPRAMREDEIENTIERFAHAAEVCRDVGFTGIQFHSAHGYLLSSFLSPRVNQRTDRWGGSLENRKRLLGMVYAEARKRVGSDFPIAVKINSADFQRGGFDHDESMQIVQWLGEIGFDLVEISGGSYEDLVLFYGDKDAMGEPVRESTKEREAYFITFADAVRKVTDVPLMVTGGFRSRAAMNAALSSGALDVIGLARPMCTQVDAPALLLEKRTERLSELEHSLTRMTSEELGGVGELEVRQANVFADIGFFCLQIVNISQGRPVNPDMTTMEALAGYLGYETQKAEAWKGPEAVPAA